MKRVYAQNKIGNIISPILESFGIECVPVWLLCPGRSFKK